MSVIQKDMPKVLKGWVKLNRGITSNASGQMANLVVTKKGVIFASKDSKVGSKQSK